jgi:hypothetical protein
MPTKLQWKMLLNVKAGRLAHHGFAPGKSASHVVQALLEAGWVEHSMQPTGPAFVLTAAGKKACP